MLDFDKLYESFTDDVLKGDIEKMKASIKDDFSIVSKFYTILINVVKFNDLLGSDEYDKWQCIYQYLSDSDYYLRIALGPMEFDGTYSILISVSPKAKKYKKNDVETDIDRIKRELKIDPKNGTFETHLKEFCRIYNEFVDFRFNKGFRELVEDEIEKIYDELSKIMNNKMYESFTNDVIERIPSFGKDKIKNIKDIDPLYNIICNGVMRIKEDVEKEIGMSIKNVRLINKYFQKIALDNWSVEVVSCKDSDPIYFSNKLKYGKDRKEQGYINRFDEKNYKNLKKAYNALSKNKGNNVYYATIYPYLNKISNQDRFKKGFVICECDYQNEMSEEKMLGFVYDICKYILKNLSNQTEKNEVFDKIRLASSNK